MGLKIYDSNGILKTGTGGSGETNTASNIGTDGVGVYDQKVGVDLQFRNVASTDSEFLTVTLDAGDNDIDLEVLGSPAIKVKAVKSTGGTINPGDLVYIAGWSVTYSCIQIELADADDSAKMPAIGIAEDTITNTSSGSVIVFGPVTDDTTGLGVGDGIYVSTTAGAWTDTRPTGTTAAIQKIGTVSQVGASGKIFIAGALRSNDVPNLQDAYFWVGNATNRATAVTMSGEATMTNAGVVTVADGADGTAIHDNVAGEITAITEKVTPASADVLLIEDSADSNNKKRLQIANLPAGSLPATVVETDQSNTYSTGTQNFQAATDVQVKDSAFAIHDDATPTKIARFQCSGITAATTRTLTVPDGSGTIVLATGIAQTLSNKTLDNTSIINVKENGFTIEDSADSTRKASFECGTISTGTTKTYTFPDANGTFVLVGATQTLTDKTLTTPTIGDFTNAGHGHEDAAGGATLASAATPSAIHDDVSGEFAALSEKASPVGADLILIEDSAASNAKKYIQITNLPAGGEINDLAGDGINGIADDQLAVGTGANTAAYQTLPNGAIAYSTTGGTFAQAGASDLSDGTTGSGSVVLATSPTLVTPLLGTPTSGTLSNCDAFTGDSGAGGVRGLVPAPGAGDAAAGKYLDADGTWTVPPAGAEANNLETACTGILTDEVPVGSGADVATYTGTTGTGNVVRAGSPALTTPSIGDFTNSTHNHQNNAGGGTLSHNSATDNPTSGTHGVTGSVVGTTDTQTLTGKTLTLPIISADQTTTTAYQLTVDSTQGQFVYRVGSTDYALSPFDSKGHVFLSPSSGDEATFFYTTSISVTGITVKSVCRGSTPSVAYEVRYASDRSAAGTLVASGTTTSTTTVETDTFTSSIATGNFIWVECDTVSGTVDEFFIQIEIRYNRV